MVLLLPTQTAATTIKTISTITTTSFAVAIVIASLAGPQWLLTEEKIRNLNYNGTVNYSTNDDAFYITKYTKSSLWILCFAQGNFIQIHRIFKTLLAFVYSRIWMHHTFYPNLFRSSFLLVDGVGCLLFYSIYCYGRK